MKKNVKLISGLTGAACLLSGMAVAEEAVTVSERAAETYDKVANVQGEFAFAQDTLTPPDEVFNLFGTAATYACAKPGFALNPSTREEHYINVGGRVKKNFTISAEQLAKMESQKRDLVCTCAMSPSAAMASVRGVRVADLLAMADVEADANTITMKDAQGYGLAMPLNYVLEKDALLVYEIGDLPLETADGTQVQVWMPDTVARYFTRQITEIELTAEAEVPAVEGVNPEYRAKVSVLNRLDNAFARSTSRATPMIAARPSVQSSSPWTAAKPGRSMRPPTPPATPGSTGTLAIPPKPPAPTSSTCAPSLRTARYPRWPPA